MTLTYFQGHMGRFSKWLKYNVNKISLKFIDIQHNYIIEVGNECIKIIMQLGHYDLLMRSDFQNGRNATRYMIEVGNEC